MSKRGRPVASDIGRKSVDDAYYDLYMAIVRQACDDWKTCRRVIKHPGGITHQIVTSQKNGRKRYKRMIARYPNIKTSNRKHKVLRKVDYLKKLNNAGNPKKTKRLPVFHTNQETINTYLYKAYDLEQTVKDFGKQASAYIFKKLKSESPIWIKRDGNSIDVFWAEKEPIGDIEYWVMHHSHNGLEVSQRLIQELPTGKDQPGELV